jgi:hypothetical protein
MLIADNISCCDGPCSKGSGWCGVACTHGERWRFRVMAPLLVRSRLHNGDSLMRHASLVLARKLVRLVRASVCHRWCRLCIYFRWLAVRRRWHGVSHMSLVRMSFHIAMEVLSPSSLLGGGWWRGVCSSASKNKDGHRRVPLTSRRRSIGCLSSLIWHEC